VWPGKAVYPDHMNNKATNRWLKKHLQSWHDKVPYDGLWLDMNEASNFCSGTQCAVDTANETATYCESPGGSTMLAASAPPRQFVSRATVISFLWS